MNVAQILQHINGSLDFFFFTGNDFSVEKWESLVAERVNEHSELDSLLTEITKGHYNSIRDTIKESLSYKFLFENENGMFVLTDIVNFFQFQKKQMELAEEASRKKLIEDIEVLSPIYLQMFPENSEILNDVVSNKNKMRIPELLNSNVFKKIGLVKDAQICAMAMMDRCSKLFAGLDLSRFGDFEKPFDKTA